MKIQFNTIKNKNLIALVELSCGNSSGRVFCDLSYGAGKCRTAFHCIISQVSVIIYIFTPFTALRLVCPLKALYKGTVYIIILQVVFNKSQNDA